MADKKEKSIKTDSARIVNALKALGVVGGGLSLFFVVVGYIIVLSYIQAINIYGLASFPREFFMEADFQLFKDLWRFFAYHSYKGFVIAVPIVLSSQLLGIFGEKYDPLKWLLLFLLIVALVPVIYFSNWQTETKEYILYSVCLPLIFSLFLYLVWNFEQSAETKKIKRGRYMLFFVFFFIIFSLLTVANYGTYFFNIDVHMIDDFDYKPQYASDSLNKIRKDVKTKSKKSGMVRYYLLGHTSGKEIFFIVPGYIKKVIMLNKDALTYLKVTSQNIQGLPARLRTIMAFGGSSQLQEAMTKEGGWVEIPLHSIPVSLDDNKNLKKAIQ